MLGKIGRALKKLVSWRYRSSVTGKFVKREFAEAHPDTTQREKI